MAKASPIVITLKDKAHCKTCKHWDMSVELIDGRACLSANIVRADEWGGRDPDDSCAIYDASYEYKQPFVTGPNFGCVHWGERA